MHIQAFDPGEVADVFRHEGQAEVQRDARLHGVAHVDARPLRAKRTEESTCAQAGVGGQRNGARSEQDGDRLSFVLKVPSEGELETLSPRSPESPHRADRPAHGRPAATQMVDEHVGV